VLDFQERRTPIDYTVTGNVLAPNGVVSIYQNTTTGTTQNILLDIRSGTNYDGLVVSANWTNSAKLTVSVTNNYEFQLNDSFDILGWKTPATLGSFSQVVLPTLPSSQTWNVTQLYSTGVITVDGFSGVDTDGDGLFDTQELRSPIDFAGNGSILYPDGSITVVDNLGVDTGEKLRFFNQSLRHPCLRYV